MIIANDPYNVARLLLTDNSGRLYVNLTAPTTIYNGQKNVTTAGTRAVLGTSQAILSITITAKLTNTGNIYVGNSSVTSSNGAILSAGDSLSLDTNDISNVYIDSDVSGEGVSYIAVG